MLYVSWIDRSIGGNTINSTSMSTDAPRAAVAMTIDAPRRPSCTFSARAEKQQAGDGGGQVGTAKSARCLRPRREGPRTESTAVETAKLERAGPGLRMVARIYLHGAAW